MNAESVCHPLSSRSHRGFSFRAAIDAGLEPRSYKSMLHEKPMQAEAILDFKIWGRRPSLTCYFRDIRTGAKFCLSAFDNKHDGRYTPRDNNIDFSECGIEHGLYLVATVETKKGGSAWSSASLLLPPDKRDAILARITDANPK